MKHGGLLPHRHPSESTKTISIQTIALKCSPQNCLTFFTFSLLLHQLLWQLAPCFSFKELFDMSQANRISNQCEDFLVLCSHLDLFQREQICLCVFDVS